ncbi:MAG TPA: hypothetical protein VFS52_05600 [Steroidobacteraceae bacterium]|nr:hypothetical protein [Steroidobacteraceae bacterium]
MGRSFVCAFALLFVTEAAGAAAGKVLLVSGSASVERNGARELQVGDSLEQGDVVVTGEQSRVQIVMADGARIALRANSRLRIDELSLPSSVQQPGIPVAAASFGRSVATLVEGGFNARPGVIGRGNASEDEMRTPLGTLRVHGAHYTAVFCRAGDCADLAESSGGEQITDGLYVAVDDGAITFSGDGQSFTLAAPGAAYIPADGGAFVPLADVPDFVRNDRAGRVEAAGRVGPVSLATAGSVTLADAGPASPVAACPISWAAECSRSAIAAISPVAAEAPPVRPIVATTALGRSVDLVVPQPSSVPHANLAVAVPPAANAPFVAATTWPISDNAFSPTGALLEFETPNPESAPAGYRVGSAAVLGSGSNGASGIHWGRWSLGAALESSSAGAQTLTLTNASLHWIIGPTFELTPILPTSGSASFVLAGGTEPTDAAGHLGKLNAAVFSANFTTQQVATTLSLDIDGLNWFASGSGDIAAGTVRFDGTFGNVLIDGRVHGSGELEGFFSAGPMTPDQLNGVGLAYQLRDDSGELGTVSGVAAFVPGRDAAPVPVTVSRDVAYAVGNVGMHTQLVGTASDSLAQLFADSTGNLGAFAAPFDGAKNTVFRLNQGTVVNAGFDAATGIRWGRWDGTNFYVTSPGHTTLKADLSAQSLHWIAGNGYGAAPVIPLSGTADYALVGNTDPTDTLGNVGTLGAASFSADFTNLAVHSALTLTMAGRNWFARGSGTFNANSTLFNGTYDTVSIENVVTGSGNFSGFVTFPRIGAGRVAGAGLTYSIVGDPAGLGTISGSLAFQQGTGTLVTAQAFAARDIAYLVPLAGYDTAQVVRAPETSYAVNETFSLTQVPVRDSSGELVGLSNGSSRLAESAASGVVMMRWGRWADGDVVDTSIPPGTSASLALGQSSLHWIESADLKSAPVMPTTGSASYQLIGATTPTDRAGHLGVLNSATLNADFTAQRVDASVDITINGESWKASGLGAIGAPGALQSNHFAGTFTNGAVGASGTTPSGSFAGFFTNPGAASGVPIGAGFTYTLGDTSTGASVDGAAVFHKP